MPFTKGDKNINRGGRPKGSSNRTTEMMKKNVARAANYGLDFLKEDYQKLRKEDPAKALTLLLKLLEFSLPKLKAMDVNLEGEIKNTIESIKVEIVEKDESKDKNE